MSGRIVNMTVSDKQLPEDKLRINLNKQNIKLGARLFKYRDKDTRQIILVVPSLQITGYGATEEKAIEMLNFSLNDYFAYLTSLSIGGVDEELVRLGWKHVPYAHKQFSQLFVSSDGELEKFNAVADEVEHLSLQV